MVDEGPPKHIGREWTRFYSVRNKRFDQFCTKGFVRHEVVKWYEGKASSA
jgi:hypothetical protein